MSRAECMVDGCQRKCVGNRMCSAHWQRSRKGLPLDAPIARRHKTDAERFLAYTERQPDGCLLWIASSNGNGYGAISADAGGRLAHRAAWELANGEKLEGWDAVHHKCANRLCVEPSHLQRITPAENTAEMLERTELWRRIKALEFALSEASPDHPLLVTAEA